MRFLHDNSRNHFYKPFYKQTLQESVFQSESDIYNKSDYCNRVF